MHAFMYFIRHQRSRGWRFCNLLAALLFNIWDVKNMCQYQLIGYIAELGITEEHSAATRTPMYSSLSVIHISGHFEHFWSIRNPLFSPSYPIIVQITGGGLCYKTIHTLRWLVARVKQEESASLYILSIKDVICWVLYLSVSRPAR
jgi:hypothetical protein